MLLPCSILTFPRGPKPDMARLYHKTGHGMWIFILIYTAFLGLSVLNRFKRVGSHPRPTRSVPFLVGESHARSAKVNVEENIGLIATSRLNSWNSIFSSRYRRSSSSRRNIISPSFLLLDGARVVCRCRWSQKALNKKTKVHQREPAETMIW